MSASAAGGAIWRPAAKESQAQPLTCMLPRGVQMAHRAGVQQVTTSPWAADGAVCAGKHTASAGTATPHQGMQLHAPAWRHTTVSHAAAQSQPMHAICVGACAPHIPCQTLVRAHAHRDVQLMGAAAQALMPLPVLPSEMLCTAVAGKLASTVCVCKQQPHYHALEQHATAVPCRRCAQTCAGPHAATREERNRTNKKHSQPHIHAACGRTPVAASPAVPA